VAESTLRLRHGAPCFPRRAATARDLPRRPRCDCPCARPGASSRPALPRRWPAGGWLGCDTP